MKEMVKLIGIFHFSNIFEKYGNMKLNGFQTHEGSVNEYTVKKGVVIREIAKMLLENSTSMMGITTINNDKNVHNLCMYKGLDIVAVAQITFDETNKTATINEMKVDPIDYQAEFEKRIQEWVEFHDLKLV